MHSIPDKINKAITNKQFYFLINIGMVFSIFAGLGISVITNDIIKIFVYSYGNFISITIVLIASVILFINNKK